MINKCLFCGEQLVDNMCPNILQHFKPMCLNCVYCHENLDDTCVCLNDENKADAIQKIKSSFDGGYEIVGIDLSPLPLKEPSRKCKRYKINIDAITSYIKSIN